jgi:hypothetical protein
MVKAPASFDQGLFLMHFSKGKEYFEQNQFQKAREELEAAYHLRPQDEKILNMLGMTYFKLEMLPEAEEMYTVLTSNNPDVYTLQSNLGLIRLKLDKLEKAEDSLTRALEIQPSNPKAHFYLGLLYEKLEKFDKALFHYEQAHAEKMVRKIKQKLEELKSKEYTLLPFTIVEVLEPEISEPVVDSSETSVAPVQEFQTSVAPQETVAKESVPPVEKFQMTEKEITAVGPESEWREGGSSTGKMRRRDVMEAMERMDDRDEEELVEDSEEQVVEEAKADGQRVEEAQVDENYSTWEKTDPVLRPIAEPSVSSENVEAASENLASQFIPSPSPDPSFFNADDMAADISAFLAESRSEEPAPVEEDFVQEPPGQDTRELTHTLDESGTYEESEEEVAKIPTPEEVENAVAEMESHSHDAPVEEPEKETPIHEPPVEYTPYEEPVEEPPMEEPEKEAHPFGAEAIEESVERSLATALKAESPIGGAIEHTIAMDLVEHVEPLKTQELFQPANLDQFSRDRYYVQPLIGADRFLLIDPHLLEIIISDRLIVRKGTISSFTGNLSFEPWQKQMEDTLPLLQVSGAGVLFLADRRQDIYLISLNNETLYVEANHVLVVQSALKVEPHVFRQSSEDPGFSMVKVSGRGTLALTCQSKPLTLNVYEAMPANIPADALIAWSGRLTCDVLSDPEIRNIMMQPEGTTLLRFTGAGDVVVEQGSLWGERRTKK